MERALELENFLLKCESAIRLLGQQIYRLFFQSLTFLTCKSHSYV